MAIKARAKKTDQKARIDRRILAKARREDGREKPVARIKEAAERAGIYLATGPNDIRVCMFDWDIVERLDRLLQRAAESAIEAAPREIPPMFGRVGAQAAVDAVRGIREAREAFAKAMTGAL